MTRSALPTGAVTFLFTDVEESTRWLGELGETRYAQALAEHRSRLRSALGGGGGVEVDTQGDAFFYAFKNAQEAVAAAAQAQVALADGILKVRMGLHTGATFLTGEGYVGLEVHRGARIAAAGHGGQVLLSVQTRTLVEAEVMDLGEHRLKDFVEPVRLFQLGTERFPPLNTISNTNLPRPASSFIGRAMEVATLLTILRDGARLLTLTGPGGSGKTRLAIEAAAELVPKFRAGVFWVGLAAVRDPMLVQETIALALGAKRGLTEHIGDREFLLILDNLEQVVDAAPQVATLVERCSNLVVLVTSRELLHVRGEIEYPVPPLVEREAVELFCKRAHVQPNETVATLCRRLDSLPLAVELAAARMGILSAADILERLGQRLDLLKGGRDAETRQKTLRSTIAWSYELLNFQERTLFARLAVFAGGCTLEAAEAVTGAHLDTLQSLVDKNLVRRTEDRLGMLETIREYAAQQLDQAEDAELLRSRLAAYMVDALKAQGPPMFLGRQGDAFARFEREHANVRAVMEWACETGQYESACELIASLFMFWIARGHLKEARPWVEAAMSARGEVTDDTWSRMLIGASEIFRASGERTIAIALKEELLQRATDHGTADALLIPAALVNLSDMAREACEFERARELAEQSLELRVARGLNPARALISLGEIALRVGDLDRAESLLEDAARGFVALGDKSNEASTFEALGEVARQQGNGQRATALFVEALRMGATLGNAGIVGECIQGLALLALAHGHMDRAAQLWNTGHALLQQHGSTAVRARRMHGLTKSPQAGSRTVGLEEAMTLALGSGVEGIPASPV